MENLLCYDSNNSETEDGEITDEPKCVSTKCWSCKENAAKYKCPKCLIQTCSVGCVKHHKKLMDCDGIRCKSEYVPKENLTESHLLSDYRFLEEVNRCVCNNERTTTLPYPKSKGMRLQMQKASSMNIQLRLMPQNFTKRKENTTYYCFRRKSFLWHVEWLFYNTNVIEVDTRLPDQTPLRNAVTKYISTEESLDTFNPKLHEFSNESQLLFYLKNEVTPANITEYFKLNGGTGLRENLRGKTVIEFPRVIIVRPKDAATFESNLSTPCNDVRTRCSDGLQN